MREKTAILATTPWDDFLLARKKAIDWLSYSERYSDDKIAKTMAMDRFKVKAVRTSQEAWRYDSLE